MVLIKALKVTYLKKKSPEIFNPILAAVPQAIAFRKNLSLRPSSILESIQQDLYPKSTPSHELVSTHCSALADSSSSGTSAADRGTVMGDVEFQGIAVLLLM